jgi:MFS family permease
MHRLGFKDVPLAVFTLGITQIIGFGTLYYAFSVAVPAIAADLGVTLTFAYAGFSLALLLSGFFAPLAGRLIDKWGARPVMASGSALSALALVGLSQAPSGGWLIVALVAVELTAPLVLYDAAFSALAQSVGAARARRAITQMTLLGGFASTVFWPATLWLVEGWGWREAYLVFAALHLFVCLPLHGTLPRLSTALPEQSSTAPRFAPLPPEAQKRGMIYLALSFTLAGAVMSAMTAQWVPALMALGLAPGAAVTAGALMGPAQVGVRVVEMTLGARYHPAVTALASLGFLVLAMAVLVLGPATIWTAMAFALLFGLAQGLTSIVRGTLPLALFGAGGFAARLGRLAGLRMTLGALAPLALAGALAVMEARLALAVTAAVAVLALVALVRMPWR